MTCKKPEKANLDILDCKRSIIKIDGDKIYVVIGYYRDAPWEIFTTTPYSWLQDDTRKGIIDTANRLSALALQNGVPVDAVTDQLRKSAVKDTDYSSQLAVILSLS